MQVRNIILIFIPVSLLGLFATYSIFDLYIQPDRISFETLSIEGSGLANELNAILENKIIEYDAVSSNNSTSSPEKKLNRLSTEIYDALAILVSNQQTEKYLVEEVAKIHTRISSANFSDPLITSGLNDLQRGNLMQFLGDASNPALPEDLTISQSNLIFVSLGDIHRIFFNYQKAHSFYSQALSIAKNNYTFFRNVISTQSLQQYDQMLALAKEWREFAKTEHSSRIDQYKSRFFLSLAFKKNGNLKEAQAHFSDLVRELRLEDLTDNFLLIDSILEYSSIQKSLGKANQAERLLLEASELSSRDISLDLKQSLVQELLAELYLDSGKPDRAKPHIENSLLPIKTSSKVNPKDLIKRLFLKAMILRNLGKSTYNEAEEALLLAIRTAEQNLPRLDPLTIEIIYELANLYHVSEEFQKGENLLLNLNDQISLHGDRFFLEVLDTKIKLALLYESSNKLNLARRFLDETVMEAKKVFGNNSLEFAYSMRESAYVYNALGLTEIAIMNFEQSAEIRRWSQGETHKDYVSDLNNLVPLYESAGELDKAETTQARVVEIQRKTRGSRDPFLAISLNNLALLIQKRGRLIEATELFEEALKIERFQFGESHPRFIRTCANLSYNYQLRGDYPRAEELQRQVVEAEGKVYGEFHAGYANSINNLAVLNHAQHKYSEAEYWMKKALKVERKLLGNSHPDIAISLNNLAGLLQAQDKLQEAEELLFESLELTKVTLGEKHSQYVTTLDNLANLYQLKDNPNEAEKYLRISLKTRREFLSPDDMELASSINNLALILDENQKLEEAISLHREALEIEKKAVGENHPHFAISLNNLALTMQKLGRSDDARFYFQKSLGILSQIYPDDHYLVRTIKKNISNNSS